MDFSQDLTRDGVTKATIGHGGFRWKPTLDPWTAIRVLTLNRHKQAYIAAMHSALIAQ
jgi:hypothetical protein